ncbi:hypothetical protein CRUP_006796 [Coryphaenoides rupestris]|nr:hypothetical protein CRUP_006796 [Coryphaenoides rupestris]
MLVGFGRTGKSVLVGDKLSSLDPERYATKNVPFNYYTTSAMLQAVLEKPLEKKAGRNYGPPGSRRLVYFIDDMNMPEVDTYGTVQPHTLIRQHMDYNHCSGSNSNSGPHSTVSVCLPVCLSAFLSVWRQRRRRRQTPRHGGKGIVDTDAPLRHRAE